MTENTAPAKDAAGGEVVELDAERFGKLIPDHPLALVDFWAPWCAPCRAFAPVFAAAASRHPDVLFAKVNTEQEQALAGHFGIRSIPTLMIFRDSVVIFSQAGALSAGALEQVLGAARALDMDEVRREIASAETNAGEPGTGKTQDR